MKKILVLGGGGFIGGHLAKRLKEEGNHVRICDIKKHEYFFQDEICHEFILGDLTDPKVVELVIEEGVESLSTGKIWVEHYIFTGEHDADVMYNSATINLNVAREARKK
jgi:GDP-D-mannose 3', 5'-epimerase